jgi:hypothetical protein
VKRPRRSALRAAQALVLFMTSVLLAVVLVAPQPSTAVGAELLALAVGCGARRWPYNGLFAGSITPFTSHYAGRSRSPRLGGSWGVS